MALDKSDIHRYDRRHMNEKKHDIEECFRTDTHRASDDFEETSFPA